MGKLKDTNLDNRYIVIKKADLTYLNRQQLTDLNSALQTIERGRVRSGKWSKNDYVVVNLDEPWAHKVVEIVEEEYGLRQRKERVSEEEKETDSVRFRRGTASVLKEVARWIDI